MSRLLTLMNSTVLPRDDEMKQRLLETWSLVSNQHTASMIKRLGRWRVSKPKANTLNVCCDALLRNRQLVMILKAYITVITTYIYVLVLHIFALIYIASHLSSVMLEPLL